VCTALVPNVFIQTTRLRHSLATLASYNPRLLALPHHHLCSLVRGDIRGRGPVHQRRVPVHHDPPRRLPGRHAEPALQLVRVAPPGVCSWGMLMLPSSAYRASLFRGFVRCCVVKVLLGASCIVRSIELLPVALCLAGARIAAIGTAAHAFVTHIQLFGLKLAQPKFLSVQCTWI
jgi:hypothetical protein